MIIKVDDRERNKKLLSTLEQEKETILKICRLPLGDFQVEDLLLVERKTLHDLYLSIKDGRWFRQAQQLSSQPIPTMLILEGTSITFRSIGMKREAFQGALITLSLLFKIPLIRSRTPQETARLILFAARQLMSFGSPTGPVRHHPYSQGRKNKISKQIYVLQGFPGIGPKRARLLLEKYGTLKAVFAALTDEWKAIPGIGSQTIRQVKQVME